MLKKNDIVICEIIDINDDGQGVARYDNEIVFIPNSLIGERVAATIINTKSKYAIGKVNKIEIASNDRTTPRCQYFEQCGGCALQHLKYENQLIYKQKIIKQAFSRNAHTEISVESCVSSIPYEYRNKIALPINFAGEVGLYRKNSHKILPIVSCPITKPWIENLIAIINNYIKSNNLTGFDEVKNIGSLKHIVAREVDGQILITLVTPLERLPHIDSLLTELKKMFPNFGVSLNINKQNNNVILSNTWKHIYGLDQIETTYAGIKYNVSNASFFQVNDEVRNVLYSNVLDNIDHQDIVVDAYSGAGLLTAIISKKANFVYGIEIVPEATASANALQKTNNISNMKNLNGDCATILPELTKIITEKDLTIVLDPPRKGCEEVVLNVIKEVAPKKILYISCNPQTLARDFLILNNNNEYTIEKIQPFDMFPQTTHVETLLILKHI